MYPNMSRKEGSESNVMESVVWILQHYYTYIVIEFVHSTPMSRMSSAARSVVLLTNGTFVLVQRR